MVDYRHIQQTIRVDNELDSLGKTEMLVWIHLFSGPMVDKSGLYRFRPRYAVIESRCDSESEYWAAIDKIESLGLARVDRKNNVVLVPGLHKRQGGPKTISSMFKQCIELHKSKLARDLFTILQARPDCPKQFKNKDFDILSMSGANSLENTVSAIPDTLSENEKNSAHNYPKNKEVYPIDTVSENAPKNEHQKAEKTDRVP